MKSNSSNEKRGSELESLLHSEHEVIIEKMAVGGDGVARIQFKNKSIVVFVNKSAPEDKLKIKITSVEKTFLKGTIKEIVKPGPHRINPPCLHAKDCGGCAWQQIDYSEQIHQKENLLRELFQKFIPNISYEIQPTVHAPKQFHYRNRIQLKHLNNQLGYFQNDSHQIVDINECLIAENEISNEISALRKRLKPTNKLQKYELRINTDKQLESYKIGERGEGLSFSQVNRLVNTLLVSKVLSLIQDMKNVDFMTELYAGAGNFTFEIVKKFPELFVEAVELNSQLTNYAVKQLQADRLQKRLFFFTTDCASYVKRRPLSNKLIFVDPPRSGLDGIVLQKIAQQAPENLIYVSCHPVSLVRDLQVFSRLVSDNYKIEHLQIFDMFPQTDHFETLIWLKRY